MSGTMVTLAGTEARGELLETFQGHRPAEVVRMATANGDRFWATAEVEPGVLVRLVFGGREAAFLGAEALAHAEAIVLEECN